jgi:two-component system sensor histidine kinase CreC
MSLRLRLLLLLLAIYCAGGYYLTQQALQQVRPRYLESIEESLVDVSVLLAAMLEPVGEGGLREAFARAQAREFEARIFSLKKTTINLRVYVTDAAGQVVFDSTGRDEGKDYSRWNDVRLTLLGRYGARSTRDVPGDDATQVIYVAAPIRNGGRTVGVVSVGKPTAGVTELVDAAQRKILLGAAVGGISLLVVMLVVAAWAIHPLERLTIYARAVRDGKAVKAPALPGHTLRELATAFEEMRDALEGRQHVERYTQAMAHEVKAPLAAIRGAAELLSEEMPDEQRRKFIANIRGEAARIQQIVERLLELSSLEARKALRHSEPVSIAALVNEVADAMKPASEGARVTLVVTAGEGEVIGERVLLREALVNLVQNALDFSPAGGVVALSGVQELDRIVFDVEDRGPGVPDYAQGRVFERFYSLPRPGSTRKSTGLGLALVREIAHLHGGDVSLENRSEGGARARFWVAQA